MQKIIKQLVFLGLILNLIGCSTDTQTNNSISQSGTLSIHTIQGAGHISPYNNLNVTNILGVVTAVRSDGFYLQELAQDNDPATSEAILVFPSSIPNVKIGEKVAISGKVEEFYPGGTTTANLSITAIRAERIETISKEKELPKPVVIGQEGRKVPTEVIDDDQMVVFDLVNDGLDFFESLESMLVQVNDPVVVGPTNSYKEIIVLADDGKGAGIRSSRGGIIIRENDFNPERIMIDDLLMLMPDVNIGDKFEQPIIGVLDYAFGNYKILANKRLIVLPTAVKVDAAPQTKENEFSISGFNVLNLDPRDGQKKFDGIAKVIVDNLRSPDILSLGEIQDNNGAIDGPVVDASETYTMLIKAIKSAGGPKYEFVEIAPTANQDGGEAGGNIRVGFIYRTDRGVAFNHVPGGTADNAVDIRMGTKGIELTNNPGRIDPGNSAFFESRKPLVAQFEIRGHRVFVIGLHLNSKGGDTALFGRYQPPVLGSEKQRLQQAEIIRSFISRMRSIDPQVKVIILGDLNDFQFSSPIRKLVGNDLINLVQNLPQDEQFSYVYEGNSQALDHIIISPGLKDSLVFFNFIHVNSGLAINRQISDHDPTYAIFRMP